MDANTQKLLYCTGKVADKPLIYVIRGENGDMMIDTGEKGITHQIDHWIRRHHFDIKWIFLTHGHFDHAWNAQYFKRKYGAKVILHKNDRDLFCLDNPVVLFGTSQKMEKKMDKMNAIMVSGNHEMPFCKIDVFLTDDDTDYLRNIGFDADVVMLPGHTAGSMGVLQGKVLYAGDAVSAIGGDYYTSIIGENVEQLLETEKKVFEINPLIIAPGHGQPIINEKAFDIE